MILSPHFPPSSQPTPSKVVEVSTLASIYHIELNPSDVGIDDYHVVRLLLKEIASSSQLDMNHPFKSESRHARR
jgi:replication factor C subunit 3/5